MDKKRIWIFCLLGPFLALCVLRFGFASAFSEDTGLMFMLAMLVPAYFLGVLPALATAGIDQVLWERSIPYRPLAMAGVGFVFSFVPILFQILLFGLWAPMVLIWGLLGAVPAAVCSSLAGLSSKAGAE